MANLLMDEITDGLARGFAFTPLDGKKPILKNWTTQPRANLDEVRAWVAGGKNIGLRTGQVSGGIVVIDIDGPCSIDFPKTWTAQTARGTHLYYHAENPMPNSSRRIADHVDTRADGGQVVYPGSIHPETKTHYRWVEGCSPRERQIADLPQWVAERLTKSPAPPPPLGPPPNEIENRASAYLNAMPPAVSGSGGHAATYTAAVALVHGFDLSEDRAFDLLSKHFNARCTPPWTEAELRHKVTDAATKPHDKPRGWLLNDNAQCRHEPAQPIREPRHDTRDWPTLDAKALHGLGGEIVRAIEPHTEADSVALLIHLLVAFGIIIGRRAHFVADGAEHYANLFAVLVGETSRGRKGTSQRQVMRLFEAIEPEWASYGLAEGLSSGEGLIWNVRDAITKREPIRDHKKIVAYDDVVIDPGIEDKRLLVSESEFSQGLRMSARDGNTLSAVIRRAWDTGNLRTLTKNSPATATGAHIGIVGHITADELRAQLSTTEIANGFANRFLWLCVRRSKCLPEGGRIHEVDFDHILQRLRGAIHFSRTVGVIQRDAETASMWAAVYPTLSAGCPGLLGAVTARAEAQVMRLAMIYALLDESSEIRAEHLIASLAVWEYAELSCRYIFGNAIGDDVADGILRGLQGAPMGMTRTAISGLFNRHVSAVRIDAALAILVNHNRAYAKRSETDGRTVEIWFPM